MVFNYAKGTLSMGKTDQYQIAYTHHKNGLCLKLDIVSDNVIKLINRTCN